jgi:hypothetical protein
LAPESQQYQAPHFLIAWGGGKRREGRWDKKVIRKYSRRGKFEGKYERKILNMEDGTG